jgi:hypothetical protein
LQLNALKLLVIRFLGDSTANRNSVVQKNRWGRGRSA